MFFYDFISLSNRNGWTVEVIKHIFSFLPTNLKLQVDEKL